MYQYMRHRESRSFETNIRDRATPTSCGLHSPSGSKGVEVLSPAKRTRIPGLRVREIVAVATIL